MKTCFIDSKDFVRLDSFIQPLKELGEVTLYSGIPASVDEAVERAKDADAIVFCNMEIREELIRRLPNLKIIQFMGTGVTNFVDMEAAEARGIKVLNIEGYGNNAVAEFAIMAAFGAARQIALCNKLVRTGGFISDETEGMEIAGCKYGVVGTGNIGALVAKKAIALGAEVVAFDIFQNQELINEYGVKYISLEEIFAECDVISLHLKVTDKTENIVSRELIDTMKSNAVLINIARAELVDDDALYDALKEKRIRGAAIDVYRQEPPKDLKYAELDNVLLSPHVGFYTQKANDNSVVLAVESILRNLK